MKVTVYGIKSCNSMKKAFTLLDELAVDYEFHDYKKQGITKDTVSAWVDTLGIEKILNKRGTTWRKQTDDDKAQADSDASFALDLLVANTSMIKRPVIEITIDDNDKKILSGFDEQEIRASFESKD